MSIPSYPCLAPEHDPGVGEGRGHGVGAGAAAALPGVCHLRPAPAGGQLQPVVPAAAAHSYTFFFVMLEMLMYSH